MSQRSAQCELRDSLFGCLSCWSCWSFLQAPLKRTYISTYYHLVASHSLEFKTFCLSACRYGNKDSMLFQMKNDENNASPWICRCYFRCNLKILFLDWGWRKDTAALFQRLLSHPFHFMIFSVFLINAKREKKNHKSCSCWFRFRVAQIRSGIRFILVQKASSTPVSCSTRFASHYCDLLSVSLWNFCPGIVFEMWPGMRAECRQPSHIIPSTVHHCGPHPPLNSG